MNHKRQKDTDLLWNCFVNWAETLEKIQKSRKKNIETWRIWTLPSSEHCITCNVHIFDVFLCIKNFLAVAFVRLLFPVHLSSWFLGIRYLYVLLVFRILFMLMELIEWCRWLDKYIPLRKLKRDVLEKHTIYPSYWYYPWTSTQSTTATTERISSWFPTRCPSCRHWPIFWFHMQGCRHYCW